MTTSISEFPITHVRRFVAEHQFYLEGLHPNHDPAISGWRTSRVGAEPLHQDAAVGRSLQSGSDMGGYRGRCPLKRNFVPDDGVHARGEAGAHAR